MFGCTWTPSLAMPAGADDGDRLSLAECAALEPPFILRTRRGLRAMVSCWRSPLGLWAESRFLVLPGEDAFASPDSQQLGIWAAAYRFARWIALRHNFLPSLHVAFTTIAVLVYCAASGIIGPSFLERLGPRDHCIHAVDPRALSGRCGDGTRFGLDSISLGLSAVHRAAATASRGPNRSAQPVHASESR